jgi:hypothetical protein
MAHNMKGFVFTLDALFALIIAGIGVSALMYLQYSSPGISQTSVQESYSLMRSTLQESIAGLCNNVTLGNINGCVLVNGMGVYGFGTYNAPPYQSVLQSIANLYLNPQYGPYASALLSTMYPSVNSTIFINGKYAPSMNFQYGIFNGVSESATIPSNTYFGSNGITVSAWVELSNTVNAGNLFWATSPAASCVSTANGLAINIGTGGTASSTIDAVPMDNSIPIADHPSTVGSLSQSSWAHTVVTWNYTGASTSNILIYINGAINSKYYIAGAFPGGLSASGKIGGAPTCWATNTNTYSLADVQVYGSALTANQVFALYSEGIGGAPLEIPSLVSWWPFDGNANDYTTSGNSGSPSTVTYASMSAYVPSSLSASSQISTATVPLMLNSSGTTGTYNVSVVIWR